MVQEVQGVHLRARRPGDSGSGASYFTLSTSSASRKADYRLVKLSPIELAKESFFDVVLSLVFASDRERRGKRVQLRGPRLPAHRDFHQF
jgi:hypothetical protein